MHIIVLVLEDNCWLNGMTYDTHGMHLSKMQIHSYDSMHMIRKSDEMAPKSRHRDIMPNDSTACMHRECRIKSCIHICMSYSEYHTWRMMRSTLCIQYKCQAPLQVPGTLVLSYSSMHERLSYDNQQLCIQVCKYSSTRDIRNFVFMCQTVSR